MKPYAWMRLIRDSELPSTTKLVALTIGLRASQDGACYPSYERIAADTGAHRATVIRHVAHLVGTGWLLAVPRCNGRGHQANAYQLLDPRLWITGDPRLWITGGVVAQGDQVVAQDDPLGSRTGRPRRRVPNEEVAEPPDEPVDNPALAAVLNLMSRQHTSPTRRTHQLGRSS